MVVEMRRLSHDILPSPQSVHLLRLTVGIYGSARGAGELQLFIDLGRRVLVRGILFLVEVILIVVGDMADGVGKLTCH